MKQPNILFLLSDEHSFRCMGHVDNASGGEPVHTPNFDRLTMQGTIFSDTYCQMPLCTPSRLCILSGREVRGAGAWNNNSVLRPELPTLPRTLAAAGYETCLVGKMHLGGNQQFAGFRHRPYGDLTGRTGHQWEPLDDTDADAKMRIRTAAAGVTEIPESLIQDEVVARETLAFLREHQHAHPDQPWFLCGSFSHPHFPLTAPRRHFERYWPDHITEPKIGATGDAYDHPASVGARKGFQTEAIGHEELMRARAAYFGCVTYLDEVIGDLLLQLDASGLLDDTVIIYTSDHGEMAGEHNLWWKHTWHEASSHVPLLVSTPQQRRGLQPRHTCHTPVGLIDLFPTLCALAGADIPQGLDGVDLSHVVTNGSFAPDRPIFCDNLVPRWGEGTEFRMIRWQNYKYIRFRNAPPLFFDLAADPGEQANLIERGVGDKAQKALDYMQQIAQDTMDFDAAERERTERDGPLHTDYALDVPRSTGNLYLMPSGKLVNAEDPLYNPTVISDDPANTFGDWPQ